VRSVNRRIVCRNGQVKRLRGVVLASRDGKVQLSIMSYRRSYTVRALVRRAWGTEVAA
jgi:hypothetical protein